MPRLTPNHRCLPSVLLALICCSCHKAYNPVYFDEQTSLSELNSQLDKGADPNEYGSEDEPDEPPLVIAIAVRRLDLAKTLLLHGAKVEGRRRNGTTPLMLAASMGQPEAVAVLLDHGANVNAVNGQLTALEEAMDFARSKGATHEKDYGETISELISRGAVYMPLKSQQGPPRFWGFGNHFEQEFLKLASADLLEGALREGASPTADATYLGKIDKHTGFPLYLTSYWDRSDLTKILIKHGASPNKAGFGGSTALGAAAMRGSLESGQILLAAGAKVDLPAANGTPLLYAAGWGQVAFVKLLLAHGANPNWRDKEGNTILRKLLSMKGKASEDQAKAITILKEHGAKSQ